MSEPRPSVSILCDEYKEAFDRVVTELRGVTAGLAESISALACLEQIWISRERDGPPYFYGYKLRKQSGKWDIKERILGVMALYNGVPIIAPRVAADIFSDNYCLERPVSWLNGHKIAVLYSRYGSGMSRAEWDLSQSLDYTLAEIDRLREENLEMSLRPPDRGGELYESAREHFEKAS